MLNISKNKINKSLDLSKYKSFQKACSTTHYKYFNRMLMVFSVFLLVFLFLPWTQNVSGSGYVTTLKPNQRPQTIQSQIAGRIEKWYVQEGDFVNKGDTILHLSEIKSAYLDPQLVTRTNNQALSKINSMAAYTDKIQSLKNQVKALRQEQNIKQKQLLNKFTQTQLKKVSDSMQVVASTNNYEIANLQFKRAEQLEQQGLKARKDVEEKSLKKEQTRSKLTAAQNKFLITKNLLENLQLESNRLNAYYTDKISKSESDRYSAESAKYQAEAEVAKLQNQSSNYQIRNAMYFIKAPQSGYINKTLVGGIGENIKDGQPIINIMPASYDLAVETYIAPIDIPLIYKGVGVRVRFDGWPAIFFSGWPSASYGTFAGKVVAIENYISKNGKFRILIAPDPSQEEWPKQLHPGSGAKTIALLQDVPMWYEFWRQLNGFPPNYYTPQSKKLSSDNKDNKAKK